MEFFFFFCCARKIYVAGVTSLVLCEGKINGKKSY